MDNGEVIITVKKGDEFLQVVSIPHNSIRNLLHSEQGPFIIVVNHQHSIDILFLFEIWYVLTMILQINFCPWD